MRVIPDLSNRRRQAEEMDRPHLPDHLHREALQGLARLNRISRSPSILWRGVRAFAKKHPGKTIRLLDIASGAGDVPIALAMLARRDGVALDIVGCDISPFAVSHATEQACRREIPVTFFLLDVLNDDLPTSFDIMTSSLFLHHLDEHDAIRLLKKMAGSSQLVLINDLIRSTLGYVTALAATKLLSRSPIVHIDGPRSVEGAFTMSEARHLAEAAGLTGAVVSWRFPERFLLSWQRS